MRISTIVAAVLVLLAGAVGYYWGAQQRRVEPDAWGLASEKIAFSNQYDCEVDAFDAAREQYEKDVKDGGDLIAQYPEAYKQFLAERAAASGKPADATAGNVDASRGQPAGQHGPKPADTPTNPGNPSSSAGAQGPGCEPLTFAQVRARGLELMRRYP